MDGVIPLPGAIEDPVPGESDLELGLEQRKKPQRNVVLTIEQKEKLQEWQHLAEHGFEIHRRAERYYEQVNFWTLSLPSVVLSAVATVWTLATEQTNFPNNRVYIASISGVTTIVSSVGSYWRWQARMEKNRFASERYNSLLNRLTLLKARLQMGDVDFSHVLQEVENTIHEILKTCGPPDLRIQQRFEWEEKTSQFELLDRLTTLRDSQESPWIRCCFPCCWRSCMKLCPCCKRKVESDGVAQPMTILNQKIREFSKKTQDVSVDEFKDYFWQLFRMASNSNNLEMCKSLIKAVPNSLSDDKDVTFKSVEPSKKSPLHFAVQDNFHQLGQWLFETYPKQIAGHCLIQDCHNQIPLDYMPTERNERSRWSGMNSREGGGAAAFYTKLLFETTQQWCIEMSASRSFEDKERMQGHGKELCRRIKLFRERHVEIACSKRHTVLHLLAVHGVEEQEPLMLWVRDRQPSQRSLLSWLIHEETGVGPDMIDAKDSVDHKAPLELAAEQRHAHAFKMLLEMMLETMHKLESDIDSDSKKADRSKALKDVVEKSLIQLREWPKQTIRQKEDKEEKAQECCSCSRAKRFRRLEDRKLKEDEHLMADFAHMKIQLTQANGKPGYSGTLLHLACGADDLIDVAKLTPVAKDSLAKLLLEAKASNTPDNEGRTPLSWAIAKGHWTITWDICKYGISNDLKDIREDIEQCLQAPAAEFSTFWVCQEATKALEVAKEALGFSTEAKEATDTASFQLWLYFANRATICLDVVDEETKMTRTRGLEGVHGALQLANKTTRLVQGKEHRMRFKSLEIPVAPVAFKLEATEEYADTTAGRAGFRLKASGPTDPRQSGKETQEPQLLIENMPLKEWTLTELMTQRQRFMNNQDGGVGSNRETLWHLACRYKNVSLAKQLLRHGAHYAETRYCTPLDLVGCADGMCDEEVEQEDDSSVSESTIPEVSHGSPTTLPSHHQASASAAGRFTVDEQSRELAKLLIFLDYRLKLDRYKRVKGMWENEPIVDQYARRFHLDGRALISMRDDDDKVLLHWAAKYGHRADVEWLLGHGAQVVVYDQLAFHDLRVTIVKPSKQELKKEYAAGIPVPEFFWRKTPRAPAARTMLSLHDIPTCLGMYQESVTEMVTWNVRFERPERLDGFQWRLKREEEGEGSQWCWALEARSSLDGLPIGRNSEEWVLLNLELEGCDVAEMCELHTQRTPLDYALEESAMFSDGATDEASAARHSTVCKLLIDEAVKGERQQEGKRGTLIRQTLASYCRPSVRVRTLSKALVDLTIKEEGGTSTELGNTTLLHVAAKHGLVDVCSELVRRGCMFKQSEEVGNQSPLDVAHDRVHESLIVPTFLSICKSITSRKKNLVGPQESISTRIARADESALELLRNLKSQNKPLWRILGLTNPHDDNYGIMDYAAMFCLKGFLKDIIDRIAVEIEDNQPVDFKAELIGTALPRHANSKDFIDEIRKLFADKVDSAVWKKTKLKTLLTELSGMKEEEKLSKIREHKVPFYHLASIATDEALEIVKLILKEDQKAVKSRDPVDNTALHLAANRNNQAVVQLLCDSKAHTEVMNMHQERPLHLAARSHSYECVKCLLERGALPHLCNSKKETPLRLLTKNLQHHLSRQRTDVDFRQVMQLLIDRLHGDKDQYYLLEKDEIRRALDYLFATESQLVCDPIIYLMKKLPDAERRATILDWVRNFTLRQTSCSPEILKALLLDANPMDVPDILASRLCADLFTPLQRSAWKGHAETTRVILDVLGSLKSKEHLRKALEPPGPAVLSRALNGFSVDSVDEHELQQLGYYEDERREFLAKKDDSCELHQLPPLRLAARQNHVEAAKEIARGFLEVLDIETATATDEVSTIIKRDLGPERAEGDLEVEVRRVFDLGDQSLLSAVKDADMTRVKDILTQRQRLAQSCRDAKGNSALHYAFDLHPSKQVEMCKLLLENFCSLDANKEGKTPLQVLCERRALSMQDAKDCHYNIQYPKNNEEARLDNFKKRTKQDPISAKEEVEDDHENDQLWNDTFKVDTDLTASVLASAVDRKDGEGTALEKLLGASSGDNTAFDILCHGLENAAFHKRGHAPSKFLRDAWLKPLRSQRGDFTLPGKMNMTLLALAVLVRSDQVWDLLDSGDPLEAIWEHDTALCYALYLKHYKLVDEMLQRVKNFDRLLHVLKDEITSSLIFAAKDLVERVIEILPPSYLVQFLDFQDNLEKCFQKASPRMFGFFRDRFSSEVIKKLPESVSEWRFGAKEWTAVHVLASIGDLDNLEELCKTVEKYEHISLGTVLNTKDRDNNTALHHLMDFLGCIHVPHSTVPICEGCYFPQKAADAVGRLYFKNFGSTEESTSVYIRLQDDSEQLRWVFESDDGSDRFSERYFQTHSDAKVAEDEFPMNKSSWEASTAVKSCVELDALDDGKRTPQVAQLLIRARADIFLQNRRGRTPLQECLLKPALKRFQEDIAELSVALIGFDTDAAVWSGAVSGLQKILVRQRDSDGLNAMEAAANIPWCATVWQNWFKSLPLGCLNTNDICKPLNVALEHGWHLPRVRRVQSMGRLLAASGALAIKRVEQDMSDGIQISEPGFSSCLATCLLEQNESLLKKITCFDLKDLEKIWLVSEPVDETKPLYSCHNSIHSSIEIDFMDIVEQIHPDVRSGTAGSVDACIGIYRKPCLADAKEIVNFFLNGVRGECEFKGKCLEIMERSPFRAVGLPRALKGSGKFYYEVELSGYSYKSWGIIGWATESFTRFEEGHFMGYELRYGTWATDPESIEVPFFDSSQSTVWWDDADVFWSRPTVFGLAVDIDKRKATITQDGVTKFERKLNFPPGKRIFPILHTAHRPRIKLRRSDWMFAENENLNFSEYNSWVDTLESDHKLLVWFKDVKVDARSHPWKLELRIEFPSHDRFKNFRAKSLLSTVIGQAKTFPEKMIELLLSRGCRLSHETLITSLRCGTAVEALRRHGMSMVMDLQVWKPWIFGAFLMYLQRVRNDDDLQLVCEMFSKLGTSLTKLGGAYIHVRDSRDDVAEDHLVEGVYVRCDDDASDGRRVYLNLCRSDQYILYDQADSDPMWKVGLTSEFLEGGEPPWYFKTSDLSKKLREVVAGKEITPAERTTPRITQISKGSVARSTNRKETARSVSRPLQDFGAWVTAKSYRMDLGESDRLKELQKLLEIPQKNMDIFHNFYAKEKKMEDEETEQQEQAEAHWEDEEAALGPPREEEDEQKTAQCQAYREQGQQGDDYIDSSSTGVHLEEVHASVPVEAMQDQQAWEE